MCLSHIPLFLQTEPAAAPQTVETIALLSTAIEVSWEKVSAIDENGIIIVYEVQYVPLQTFGGALVTETVNTTLPVLNIILTDLQEYVEYNISVRAYTIVGAGPYSDPVPEITLEDGIIFWSTLFIHCIFSSVQSLMLLQIM